MSTVSSAQFVFLPLTEKKSVTVQRKNVEVMTKMISKRQKNKNKIRRLGKRVGKREAEEEFLITVWILLFVESLQHLNSFVCSVT